MASGVNDDVFGYKRNPKPRGVFSTENSKLTFGDVKDPVGWLVQNWSVQYAQDVQELFEIGSNQLYWAKGRPQGTGNLARIVGDPSTEVAGKSGSFFPQSAYDICDGGATMELTARGGNCETKGTHVDVVLNKELVITMSGIVVTSIGFNMAVADVRLIEGFGWRFAYMKMGSGGAT